MALRGNLKDFSLPDVFQLVTFSRKTGVLRIVREDGARGSVWFRDGDVFFAQSNWHTEPLGERLVRAQRITSQALARALALRADEGEDGRRLGTILVDEGYITDEVLSSFVSEQIQETIFDLMCWDEGDFDFEAIPEAVEEDIGLSVSIENVIMEGSRRLEEWTRIKKKIPSVDVVFKMATAPSEGTFEISLKPTEWNLLLLIDGTRSVAELAHVTERTDLEVARIIYGLFSAGLLEFATDEEVSRLRAERQLREERLAVLEAERLAIEEQAAAAEALARESLRAAEARAQEDRLAAEERAREAALIAEVEAARAHEAEVAPTLSVPAEQEFPAGIEVPEFLGGMSAAPTADDAAVLEEMMGAVLYRAAAPEAEAAVNVVETMPEELEAAPLPLPAEEIPTAPQGAPEHHHVLDESPAFMAVEDAEFTELPMLQVPSVDDLLMDLADLQVPDEGAATAAVADVEAADAAATAVAAWGEAEAGLGGAQDDAAFLDLRASLSSLGVEPLAIEAGETAEAVETFTASAREPEAVVEPQAESMREPEVAIEPEAASELLPEFEPLPGSIELEPMPPMSEPSPVVDYERDLMALGLGELPADLFDGGDAGTGPDVVSASAELVYEWVETAEPEVEPEVVGTPIAETEIEMPDFSELLESLDVEPQLEWTQPETVTAAPIIDIQMGAGFDEELLRGDGLATTGGVISTDAYLDDIAVEDFNFSGGLTDELSALTGADRPNRPTAMVNRIPASGEVLHRDSRVDKDTLLKIIDGIKNL